MSQRTSHLALRLGLVAAVIAAVLSIGIGLAARDASAATSAGGFTTSTVVNPKAAALAGTLQVTVSVTASTTRTALVDVEFYGPSGQIKQTVWDAQSFVAGQRRHFVVTWKVPVSEPLGSHSVKVGIFQSGWGSMYLWDDAASTFTVKVPPSATTTTTGPPSTTTTTTTPPSTTTTTTTPPSTTTTTTTTRPPATTTTVAGGGHFSTLGVGAALPTDANCAARVRKAPEVRLVNTSANQTKGVATSSANGPLYARVDGNFTGTTDELIQWAACKWGFDEDIIRAQVAKESWWFQSAAGDFTTDPSRCAPSHPIGADGQVGQCPESIGVLQIRYPYWAGAFPSAGTSTAYNLDYALAARRSCFEGYETWLNTVERGAQYAAGDLWGCIGLWFSGRWYTPPSNVYIAAVKDYLAQRVWETPGFINS